MSCRSVLTFTPGRNESKWIMAMPSSDSTTCQPLSRYLRHVLERIADHPVNRIHQFQPWNLAAILPTISPKSQVST